MSRDYFTMEELARQLGQDVRAVEKQVSRGRIPGRRVGGEWRFNASEITTWLEKEIPDLNESELAVLEKSQRSTEVSATSPVSSLLLPALVEVPLDAGTRPAVLKRLVDIASQTWQVFDKTAVLAAIKKREEANSTAFPGGVAIPHPENRMPDALGESVIAFGRTLSGIPFGGPSRQMTDLFFLVLARDANTHLKILTRLSRMFQTDGFLDKLRAADSSAAAYDVIVTADAAISD